MPFWHAYWINIHDKKSYFTIGKFIYLRSVLMGRAEEAVMELSLTVNYDKAVSILETQFFNEQQVVNKYMDVLLNLGPVASATDIISLQHTLESNIQMRTQSHQSHRWLE
jgi:protoporphyrinogen oxidase